MKTLSDRELKNINAYKIAGGGDTLNAINTFKLDNNFTYLSSGGGASLEYISSDHLEAIDYLENIEKEWFSTKFDTNGRKVSNFYINCYCVLTNYGVLCILCEGFIGKRKRWINP